MPRDLLLTEKKTKVRGESSLSSTARQKEKSSTHEKRENNTGFIKKPGGIAKTGLAHSSSPKNTLPCDDKSRGRVEGAWVSVRRVKSVRSKNSGN